MPQCVGYHRVLLHLKPYLGLVFCLDKAGDLLIISFVFPVSFLVDLLIQFHAGMQAKKGVGLLGNMFRESEINCLGGCGSGGGLATYISIFQDRHACFQAAVSSRQGASKQYQTPSSLSTGFESCPSRRGFITLGQQHTI